MGQLQRSEVGAVEAGAPPWGHEHSRAGRLQASPTASTPGVRLLMIRRPSKTVSRLMTGTVNGLDLWSRRPYLGRRAAPVLPPSPLPCLRPWLTLLLLGQPPPAPLCPSLRRRPSSPPLRKVSLQRQPQPLPRLTLPHLRPLLWSPLLPPRLPQHSPQPQPPLLPSPSRRPWTWPHCCRRQPHSPP